MKAYRGEGSGLPRCRHCGDVIGVYEPVILRSPDGDRRTSRIAEPHLFTGEGAWYHELCFDLLDDPDGEA